MRVYGKNVFNELKENKKNIKRVYLSNSFNNQEIMTFIKDNKISYEKVDNKRLDIMTLKNNHQGIVVDINDYEYCDINDLLNEEVIVMLDHLEDPHNFGAIIRTCEALGVKGIIIPKNRCVDVNSTVMKTSSGALNYLNISQVNNLVDTINKFKLKDYFIYGAEADGKDCKTVDYAKKCILIMGSEGKGLSRLVRENCDEIISIPLKGNINSLNVSVAAGILLNEIVNRR